ncbi:MAG: hypothetical protein JWQ53_1481 [Klenkia sp.]|nr:hypothetical protein [Klenkia sp.]
MTREELLARYRELVLGALPHRARAEGRVLTAEHCSGPIVGDPLLPEPDRQRLVRWGFATKAR